MNDTFSGKEKQLIAGMSLLMGIRMLGVSLIIPVFSILATEIEGSTKTLAGIAVGIYGISQTLFQVPLGKLSDMWGRKQTTLLGLVIYVIGTILSGLSGSIYHLIISRFIAGAGAVSGVTMAWLTEGINSKKRNMALSVAGISIGLSVVASFTLSPIIAGKLGIPYLFYLCAAITFISILYTLFFLKNNGGDFPYNKNEILLDKDTILTAVKNIDILRLNCAGFLGNMSLTGMFFVMPLLIKERIGVIAMWKIYVPMAIIGTFLMFYFGRKADIRGTVKIGRLGFLFELAGAALPLVSMNILSLLAGFILFYSGHCIISPVLPAAVSKYPAKNLTGSTLSAFNSFQFMGSGLGGVLAGYLFNYAPSYIFSSIMALSLCSMIIISGYRDFSSSSS